MTQSIIRDDVKIHTVGGIQTSDRTEDHRHPAFVMIASSVSITVVATIGKYSWIGRQTG
jgi:hypothetical protein